MNGICLLMVGCVMIKRGAGRRLAPSMWRGGIDEWSFTQKETLVQWGGFSVILFFIFIFFLKFERYTSFVQKRNGFILSSDYRYELRTGPLSCFASTNSWFVMRNHQNEEFCNSGIHLINKIPISNFYFTASQNGTTRLTDESWWLRKFCIPFSNTGFTG